MPPATSAIASIPRSSNSTTGGPPSSSVSSTMGTSVAVGSGVAVGAGAVVAVGSGVAVGAGIAVAVGVAVGAGGRAGDDAIVCVRERSRMSRPRPASGLACRVPTMVVRGSVGHTRCSFEDWDSSSIGAGHRSSSRTSYEYLGLSPPTAQLAAGKAAFTNANRIGSPCRF